MLFDSLISIPRTQLNSTLVLGLLSLSFVFGVATDPVVGQELTIGSEAPSLDIEHWVSDRDGAFSPITEFESDKVYVVEFWATWCGPCISSMPHLVELQNEYADKDVQLISISSESLEKVETFLERNVRPPRGSKPDPNAEPVTYGELTSAYCLTTDPDRSVNADYMKAAGRTGIPCAFIVGKTGLVEWIGHPMRIDEPLKNVVEGNWDREVFAVEFAYETNRDETVRNVGKKMSKGDVEGAIADLNAFLETIPADHKDQTKLKSLRQSLQLSADGEVAVNAMSEIAESDDDMRILKSVATIAAQAEKGREIDDALAAVTLKAADGALARSNRQLMIGLFSKSKLLFELGRFEEALASQKKLLGVMDNQGTRSFLEKIEKSIADAEAKAAAAEAAEESEEKDDDADEDADDAEKAPEKDDDGE